MQIASILQLLILAIVTPAKMVEHAQLLAATLPITVHVEMTMRGHNVKQVRTMKMKYKK